jgi:hypothetical protein
MPFSFKTNKSILWIFLAGSVAVTILYDFWWPSFLLLAISVGALGYWLSSHQNEIRAQYELSQSRAGKPSPKPNPFGTTRLTLKDIAPFCALGGLSGFYFGYAAAHGDPPTKILILIHKIAGIPGVVAFWSVLGVILLSIGVEAMIGSREKR